MDEYGENPFEKIKTLEKIIEESSIRESTRIANLEQEKEDLQKKLLFMKVEYAILKKNTEPQKNNICHIS
tara:strand:- start:84 stop:293 length:210 start_codon:yes stop_codon:yes gene_type:complete